VWFETQVVDLLDGAGDIHDHPARAINGSDPRRREDDADKDEDDLGSSGAALGVDELRRARRPCSGERRTGSLARTGRMGGGGGIWIWIWIPSQERKCVGGERGWGLR
jgi:hypothetical protein